MIQKTDLLNLNFYKKEIFTGSFRGMRYLIRKDTADRADSEPDDVLTAVLWPGPYNDASTPDEKKTAAQFTVTEEGLTAAADWLNDQWLAKKDEWPDIERGYTVYE